MHNIAEGFDAGSNAEFMRFLNYAKRSCTEVQSELYVAFDRRYLTQQHFNTLSSKSVSRAPRLALSSSTLRNMNPRKNNTPRPPTLNPEP
jgi:four helix bundle protein